MPQSSRVMVTLWASRAQRAASASAASRVAQERVPAARRAMASRFITGEDGGRLKMGRGSPDGEWPSHHGRHLFLTNAQAGSYVVFSTRGAACTESCSA